MDIILAYKEDDNGFRAYYKENNKIKTKYIEYVKRYYFVKDNNSNEEYYSIDEKGNKIKLKKVYGDFSSEADIYGAKLSSIDFTRLELGIRYNYENMRVGNIDIETEDKDGFPDIEKADKKILCYTYYDSYKDIYYIHGLEEINVLDLAEKIGNMRFKFFVHKTEKDMIKWFVDLMNSDEAPDILTGWNVNNFDFDYLKNRARNFALDDFDALILFDMLDGYMHINHAKTSYKLDDVSNDELGYGKVPRGLVSEMKPLDRYYYNYVDVKLVNDLNNKFSIIHYHEIIANKTNVDLLSTFYPTQFVYMIMQTVIWKKPLKFKINLNEVSYETIEGGFVFEPSEGIFKNVLVLDLSGSYPSAILTYNISPDTIKDNGFNTEVKGVLPSVIEGLLEERKQMKKMAKDESLDKTLRDGYNVIQYALKTIINSFYGVFVSGKFLMFNIFVASKITEYARGNIKYISEIVKEKGYKILYGDTDSIFIQAMLDDTVNEGKKLEKFVNDSLNERFEKMGLVNRTKIDFEKSFETWLQAGVKKRYAGITNYPKKDLMIKGFEVVRRGNSIYTKRVQRKFIELLLTDTKKASEYYNHEEKKWQNKNQPLKQIGIDYSMRTNINEYATNNIMVKSVKNSMKLKIPIDLNLGKIQIYYLKDGTSIAVNNYNFPKEFEKLLDWETQKIAVFDAPLDRLKILLGEQTKLDIFF